MIIQVHKQGTEDEIRSILQDYIIKIGNKLGLKKFSSF